MDLTKKFSSPKQKYYIVGANGSQYYTKDQKFLREIVNGYRQRGIEFAIYKIVPTKEYDSQ